MALGVLASVALLLLHVARPWPLKWLVDALAGHHVPHWVPAGLPRAVPVVVAIFLALAAAGAAAEYAQVMLLNGLGNRILFRFRSALFAHLVRQPLAYHESHDVGELLTRVVSDTSRLRRGINGLLVKVAQTLALFAATLGVVLWISPVLGIVLAAAGVAALGAMRASGRRIAGAAKRQRKREGALAALVGSELAHIRELQLYGEAASGVMRGFARRNNRSLGQEQKVRRFAAGLTVRVDLVIAVGVAVALGFGAFQVGRGTLTAGDLVLFLSYALALRHPFVGFAYQTARIGRTYACAERLARIAERASTIVDAPLAEPAPRLAGALRLESVSLKSPRRVRGARKWALDGLACELPAGQRVALIGGNGSGKSTLLRLVPRLSDPDSGRVLVGDRDLRDWTLASLRDQIGVVFQDVALPGLTVAEVIALGRPGASVKEIHAAAKRARVHDFVKRLPQGYDTVVRRGGDLLSGGERRRLAIACALLRDGAIWLLDEPTAALDDETSREIVAVLLDATRGRTTLWVTHDADVVRQLDWVLELDRGRAVFCGPAAQYLEQHAVGRDTAAPMYVQS